MLYCRGLVGYALFPPSPPRSIYVLPSLCRTALTALTNIEWPPQLRLSQPAGNRGGQGKAIPSPDEIEVGGTNGFASFWRAR